MKDVLLSDYIRVVLEDLPEGSEFTFELDIELIDDRIVVIKDGCNKVKFSVIR